MAPKKRSGGGGLSRRAALALIGGGSLLGVSSTGAFNTVDGKRPFAVSTSNDPNALLGLTEIDEDKTYSQSYSITVTNQTGNKLDNNNITTENKSLKLKEKMSDSVKTSLSPGVLQPGDTYTFYVVTSSNNQGSNNSNGSQGGSRGNSGKGKGNSGKGCEIRGDSGNGGGQSGEGEDTSDTLIFSFFGPQNTIELEREITVSAGNSGSEFDPLSCKDVIDDINAGAGMAEINSSGDSLPKPKESNLSGNVCHVSNGSDPSLSNNGRPICGFLYVQGPNVDVTVKKDVHGAVVIYADDGDADLKIIGNKTIHGDACIQANNDVNVTLNSAAAEIKGDVRIDAAGNVTVDNSNGGTIGGETYPRANLDINGIDK